MQEEAQRLDEQQRVFLRIFDHRLIFPPIRRLRRVLDCGHGSASWAVDVAEQYPECEVIGVDIAPHMSPDDVPENLWLQVSESPSGIGKYVNLEAIRISDILSRSSRCRSSWTSSVVV